MLCPFLGDELEFSCVEDIQDGGLVLGIFVADLDKLLLKFGPFGAEEYGTGGVGVSLCMLHPNLQLVGIDAAVIKEAGLGFNVCRVQDLYVGQVSDRVCKVDAYSEDIYLGLFGLGRDACSTEGE
jgi:hypothetical protein